MYPLLRNVFTKEEDDDEGNDGQGRESGGGFGLHEDVLPLVLNRELIRSVHLMFTLCPAERQSKLQRQCLDLWSTGKMSTGDYNYIARLFRMKDRLITCQENGCLILASNRLYCDFHWGAVWHLLESKTLIPPHLLRNVTKFL
jgi:hypothetical protein